MKTINIIGVPEHFNYPWIRLADEQPLKEQGILLNWQDESRGSGAMNKALREKKADIAILLTESFIKDKTEGNPGKILGYHVLSPLTWGIHVPADSKVVSVKDLEKAPFLISRYGSGSHLMAFLLAKQNNWKTDRLQFEVVGNMDGAREAFEDQQPKAFLWEKYTTKPLVDQGVFRRVGEIPTPWPCFVIVAHEELLKEHPEKLQAIQRALYQKTSKIRLLDNLSGILSQAYGIQEADIKAWLSQTEWATNNQLKEDTLEKTLDILSQLALIDKKIPISDLVAENFVNLY
ncbi:substrate-binding domain-containing protein [Echinicola sediminis]